MKDEGRRKKEEGRRKKEEGRRPFKSFALKRTTSLRNRFRMKDEAIFTNIHKKEIMGFCSLACLFAKLEVALCQLTLDLCTGY